MNALRNGRKILYPGHVPLGFVERNLLAIGSAVGSLLNPRRADLIATLGETTAQPYFIDRLRNVMLSDRTGRQILRERPRMTSKTLDVEKLRQMPVGCLGREYVAWLGREGVSPDTRLGVRFIDDEELAYVMQRYRECHDFYHATVGLPVNVEGETALKLFEWQATMLPMTLMSAIGGTWQVKSKSRKRLFQIYFPWAISNGARAVNLINVYWENELETPIDELRSRLGIEKPPDLRALRKKKTSTTEKQTAESISQA